MTGYLKALLTVSTIILLSCGSHPLSQTDEQKTQKIQTFFASVIEPTPEESKATIPFKQVCLDNLEALYFIINDPELVEKSGIPTEILNAIPRDFNQLKGHSLEVIHKVIQAQPDSFFQENQTHMDKAVSDFKFKLDQLQAIKVPKLGNVWTEFFQKILTNYFPDLALEDKKHILAFMIRQPKKENSETEALLNSVYASGPYFQKYMQLMGDKLEPGDDAKLNKLKDGLMTVKSKLPSISKADQENYLKELRAKGVDLEILRSLGAGSVGEVFLVKNKKTGTQLVVKLIRPGIREIARRERLFFENQASSPTLKKSFAQMADQIDEELDYTIELKKLKKGIEAYGEDGSKINVVKPILDFPNGEDYFAMELVDGETFDQLGSDFIDKEKKEPKPGAQKKRDAFIKSILWEKIIRKFLQKALFDPDNAFFHGDLHEGNIMVVFSPDLKLPADPSREDVQAEVNNGHIQLVLIDFGNAHSLSQDERRRLKNIFLSASVLSNSSEAFLDAMLEDDDLDPEKRLELKQLLDQTVFSDANSSQLPSRKIGEAMDILIENGVVIPLFLMAFKRSLSMLHDTYLKVDPVPGNTGIRNTFEDAYTNNLKDILWHDDSAPGKANFWNLIDNIIFEGEAIGWEKEHFNYFVSPETYKKVREMSLPGLQFLRSLFKAGHPGMPMF